MEFLKPRRMENGCEYYLAGEVRLCIEQAARQITESNSVYKELDSIINHQKYKRCLAMASWCCDACDKWMMRKAKAIGLGKEGVKEYHQARSKLFLYARWQMRWLKIAEQFKEGI